MQDDDRKTPVEGRAPGDKTGNTGLSARSPAAPRPRPANRRQDPETLRQAMLRVFARRCRRRG